MKIADNSASLRIVDSTRLLGAFCLAWAVLAAALLVYEAMTHKVKGGDLLGFGLMTLLPLIVGVANWDRTDFQFDKSSRTLTWRRQRMFRPQGGTVSFSAISGVAVETTFNPTRKGTAKPGHRLVLHMARGPFSDAVLPVTGGYAGDVHQKLCEEAAARIREILPEPRA